MDLPHRIGRYEVELTLGQGEWGRVLLARDTVIGRHVALKTVRDDVELAPGARAAFAERLTQEARAAATLSHPGIVTLLDMGQSEESGPYLVYEMVHGPSLRERLANGPLPAPEVASLARSVGAALAYAHQAGIVHRNVKPENVMLAASGARLTCTALPRPSAFRIRDAGNVPQAPSAALAYAAPEVLAADAFSPYSDQFSLAATLYEALTGRRAFPGIGGPQVAARVATGKQPPPTSLHPALRGFAHLDPLFDRALAKEPKNRFPSCEAFVLALASELDGTNAIPLLSPAPRSSIVPRATRRWQNVVAIVAVTVIVLLASVGPLRRAGEADGISLRRVADAFAGTLTPGRPAPSATPHHVRPLPPLPSAAAPNELPAGSTSDAPDAALDSRLR